MDWLDWEESILDALDAKNYKKVLLLMACNVGDRGNIKSMIEGFLANADPLEPEEMTFVLSGGKLDPEIID